MAKAFTSLNLLEEYRSDTCDIVNDFYLPCLSTSSLYSRATGYFSSTSLALVGKGLSSLIANDGDMRLIASPQISSEDLLAISRGLKKQKVVLSKKCELSTDIDDISLCRIAFLEHLIAIGKLKVKLAIPSSSRSGIYHEKIGLFEDSQGNIIAFTGSNNETAGGMVNNFESCNVFTSFDAKVYDRALAKKKHFENMWKNQCKGLEIIDFTEETADKLLPFKQFYKSQEPFDTRFLIPVNKPRFPNPSKFKLRNYQKIAIEKWFENNGVGYFAMCTGAGKTITAISALTLATKANGDRLFVIIIAPYTHLVTQWESELSNFNISPLKLMGSSEKWVEKLSRAITDYESKAIDFVCLVATNRSFTSKNCLDLISRVQGNFILIADEAHNMGSEKMILSLPENANLRVALSATPQRHFDEDGTDALKKYFGKEVINFSLKDALEKKFLTPYYYNIIPVYLNSDECEEFELLSLRIEKLSYLSNKTTENLESRKILESLLFKRARLIGSAAGKIPKAISTVYQDISSIKNTLFYCGDGNVKFEGEEYRQIDVLTKILGEECQLNVRKFTADENLQERKEITEKFISGELDALVAIRCLDEGVDIPKINKAFILASTSNPKQFIQRRGRVLRKFPGKKHATIYDFLVVPDPSIVSFKFCRNMLRNELRRINEFAELALNGSEQIGKLLQLKKSFNLLDA